MGGEAIGNMQMDAKLQKSDCSSHLGAVRLKQCTPVYVIAACSEKERPDSFTHSKKGSPQLLTNLTAQRLVQQPEGRSPTAPNESLRSAKTARSLHTVGTSMRMRRAPRKHALAVGETAPTFPTAIPLHNLSNNGSQPQSASVGGDSRVAER